MEKRFFRNRFLKRIKTHEIIRCLIAVVIFFFSVLPLFFLLGSISSADFSYIVQDEGFYKAILNSLLYSLASSIAVLLLALLAAYFVEFSDIKGKKIWVVALTLPMLVPTLSIGLGIRVLGGSYGFLDQLIHWPADFLGLPGLIIGSIVVGFPPTFLVLFDALHYENKECYDAANVMGIGRFSTFFRLTIPYLKIPLITAFFACFTLIFSDYGIPMEVAGKVKTLPMYLYEQVVSTFQYGRAALAGLILLLPAVISFTLDFFLKEERGDEQRSGRIKPTKFFNAISATVLSIVSLFLFIPQFSFVLLAFIEGYPNNMVLSFSSIAKVFSDSQGVGLAQYLANSLIMASFTGALGVVLAFLSAYFAERFPGKFGRFIYLFAIATIAIPGIVLGVGYIFLFQGTRGFFYGTMAILVVVNVFHFFGSPFLMAKNSLAKINKDYEIIGETLGIGRGRVFFRVILPNSWKTLLEMFSFFFVNSMITISAVAFLCTYQTQPLSILITVYELTANYEMQAAVSFIILMVNIVMKAIPGFAGFILKKQQERNEL